MDNKVHYAAVGAFVISLTFAIIIAIFWLSSGFSLDKYTTYLIYMTESVSGLNVDSTVEYNGVTVGAVKSISLNEVNPQLVEVLISIKSQTPITQGTVATLTTRGMTGLGFISLKDSSKNLRPIVIEKGQQYPIIKTAPSIFMRIDTALQQVSANLRQVADSVKALLDPDNQRAIKLTLQNIQSITHTFSINGPQINSFFNNASRASKQFGPFLESGSGAMMTLQTQTLPSTYRTLNQLDGLSRDLSAVVTQMKQNPSILIRGSEQPLLGPGE